MRDELTRQARIIVLDQIANGERPKPKTPQEVRQAIESVRGWLFIRQEARSWYREWNGLRHE